MSQEPQENPLAATVAALLSKLKPMTEEEHTRHVWESEVKPALKRWGFQERYLTEIEDFKCAEQQKAFNIVSETMRANGAIVALIGLRGCGKTTIAAQFARVKSWRNYRNARIPNSPQVCVRYTKAADLMGRFKALYADYGSIDSERLMESRDFFCTQVEYVVIDELHEVHDQKLSARLLTDILDRRYAAKMDTLLISNQTPEEFGATMSDSVLSRLSEHGVVIPCKWPSWRTGK